MISICPICHLEHEQNPQVCSCGYEGLEVYIHKKKEEYWKKQLFQIYKYTKNVYYNRIPFEKTSVNYEVINHEIIIQDTNEKRGLCLIDYESDKEVIVDMGVLALNRKVQSLIVHADTLDTDFLDESIVHILFLGPKVKKFTKGYINQHSSLKYIFVDPKNKSFTSENHALFNKKMTELICYPSDSNEQEYVVPTSVKRIHPKAFGYPTHLKRLVILKHVQMDERMIQHLKKQKIEIIGVEEYENHFITSKNNE